jgi:hypothetical protein
LKAYLILALVITLFETVSAEILERVEIIGNKRTSAHAIIQHGRIKTGEDLNEENLGIIKENLGRIDQIQIKNVQLKDGTLKIEVTDKWTFIPVPMITQSGNYYNRGVVIYDNNFLGTLGTFAPGISWSNSILNYLLYFQNESMFTPTTGIKVLVMKKSDLVEFKRFNNPDEVHESRYNSYLITPNLLYKNHVFKAGPVYISRSIYKNNYKISEDKSKGFFFRHHLNAFQTLDILYKGFVTTYDLYLLQNQNGEMVYQNEANIIWCVPVNNSFYNFSLHGYHSSAKNYLFSKNLGGDEGYRGYDKASLPISQNFGALLQYQQYLFQQTYLTPFYEYNKSTLITPVFNGKKIGENTIGLGIHYYFKSISIPAVILDFARNIENRSNHFHINVGLSI